MNKNTINWVETTRRPTLSEYASEQPLPPYPLNLFPKILSDPVYTLHADAQIPLELMGNVILSAASLACQSLIEVIQPHTNTPAPCSLYFFSIAESGAGKSTIKNVVMQPFYDFDEKMRHEYVDKKADYDAKIEVWKIKNKTLIKNLHKAIDKNFSGDDESKRIVEHARAKPVEPEPPQIIYNDTAASDLISGLSRYPNAGLITDEAITYFGNRPKSKIGFLNNAWDGSAYHFRRGGKIDCHFTPCLTVSLMTQPGVFESFMDAHGKTFKESGFLSRFLFVKTDHREQHATDTAPTGEHWSEIQKFHKIINTLLNKQKERIDKNETKKKQLMLSGKALALWKEHREALLHKIKHTNEFYYIREFVEKASANTLRMSAIFQYLCNDSTDEISEDIMASCIGITDWYLSMTNQLFFDTPERIEFTQDVIKLYQFILIHCNKERGAITKSEIEQYGPNKLRKLEKLTPVLNHLIGQADVHLYKSTRSDTIYVSARNHDGISLPPKNDLYHNIHVADATNFKPHFYIDLTDVRLKNR
ncbi:TPA: DUF3987 domain-containing protein [Serratia marcescens]|nr:YfjI family protein [Serratia marcescens]MBS3894736.1 DUF3987 domain-containing protein [Serratia marcescens]HBC7422221.1 DUF3987 domain-containing protein [Serratia marcescens]